MRIIIRRVEYNTEKAKLIKKTKRGRISNDSDYIEELLLDDDGRYFIHAYGGSNSKYPDEEIIPLSLDAAKRMIGGDAKEIAR